MKHVLAGLLIIALIMSFGGCGAKEKIGEEIAEKMLEEAGGGEVDIDGDKVTLKGEDGTEMTFGGSEWPNSKLAENVPEFKKGTITTVMEASDSLAISFESVEEEDARSYLEEIKKDFTEGTYEMKSEDTFSFAGTNGSGVNVMLLYSSDSFTITLTVPAQ